jgi:hypothetical protein
VTLLLGLSDEGAQTDRTPWWLLALRLGAIATLIVAFAQPVLNPEPKAVRSAQPLLIVLDGSWADAPDWTARMAYVRRAVEGVEQEGRLVAVRLLTAPKAQEITFAAAGDVKAELDALTPAAFLPNAADIAPALSRLERGYDTLWISSGVEFDGHGDVIAQLEAAGRVSVRLPMTAHMALGSLEVTETGVRTHLHVSNLQAADLDNNDLFSIVARGPDPSGVERILGKAQLSRDDLLTMESGSAEVEIALRPEVRARVTRFEVSGVRSAGAMQLAGNALKRPEVALISGDGENSGPLLLSPLHYLRAAFEPFADIIEGDLRDLILANPDMIVLADVARLSAVEEADLTAWLAKGGTLLRFAGPRLAASEALDAQEDQLLPVRLRAGGRSVGGAMSWGDPKDLQAFKDTSPFFGLPIPDGVTVTAQIMAQPDPELSSRVLASLTDGTPLVTRKMIGQGQVVLFHVTANAQWSTLPLSGLFMSMLERLAGARLQSAEQDLMLAEQRMTPLRVLDGFGRLQDASARPAVDGALVLLKAPSIAAPAGLYQAGSTLLASNAFRAGDQLRMAQWPTSIRMLSEDTSAPRSLMPLLCLAALMALVIDTLASLALMGRLRFMAPTLIVAAGLLFPSDSAFAQTVSPAVTGDAFVLEAVSEVSLAHILTGDAAGDALVHQGLVGLSQTLAERTSVEPAAPKGVNLETDPLSLFPLLYWPVRTGHEMPSAQAFAKLNAYMRAGGVILMDTADADLAVGNADTANGAQLQAVARHLDIPPLMRVPKGHVLTRSFYLLDSFPGRYAQGDVWVEAAQNEGEDDIFARRLNDNVSPIVMGRQDWAAAWAVDQAGRPLRPVGYGESGARQRELSYRFGVNLVMYALTGNYKADQVHIPDLLERLGAK